MAEPILNQPHFQDADKAREHLEALRWPHGPVCPHCGSVRAPLALDGKSYRPGLYKCKDCYEQFTVTVGTVFERSKIALNGVDPVRWTVAGLILKPFGVLRQHAVGHARGH